MQFHDKIKTKQKKKKKNKKKKKKKQKERKENRKKENTKYKKIRICIIELSWGLKNEMESYKLNVPSVFESSRFYCRVHLFPERAFCTVQLKGTHKRCPPWRKLRTIYHRFPFILIRNFIVYLLLFEYETFFPIYFIDFKTCYSSEVHTVNPRYNDSFCSRRCCHYNEIAVVNNPLFDSMIC